MMALSKVFNSASYSLCPLGNTDWRMKADQITLNSETNKGIAKDVTVEFLGVPNFLLTLSRVGIRRTRLWILGAVVW